MPLFFVSCSLSDTDGTCRRVVGSDGSLVGYGGGLANKAALLAHEAKFAVVNVTDGASKSEEQVAHRSQNGESVVQKRDTSLSEVTVACRSNSKRTEINDCKAQP